MTWLLIASAIAFGIALGRIASSEALRLINRWRQAQERQKWQTEMQAIKKLIGERGFDQ